MNPTSEPTPADIAAVASAIGEPTNTPAPQPQAPPAPAPQMQPPAPTPQPAPSQQQTDPFAQLFASEPTPAPQEPTPPAPQPQQEQPKEPTSPQTTPQPQQPAEPQPAPQAQPTPTDDYQSFEDYMNETLKNVPKAPEAPNPEDISPDDPVAIKKFFDDLVNTAVQKATTETARKSAIQNRERALWDEAFDKYGSLRTNKNLRDMVHSIRMGHFQRGIAITPKQAADKLLESLGNQYKQGVADNQVVTTIENVQPTGGNSAAAVPTTLDRESALTAVQTGGEAALAQILDAQIKAGKTW